MSIYAQEQLLCLNSAFLQLLVSRTMPLEDDLPEAMKEARRKWISTRVQHEFSGQQVTLAGLTHIRARFNSYIALLDRCIDEGYVPTAEEEGHLRKWEADKDKSTGDLHRALPAFKPGIKVKFDSDEEEPAPAPAPLRMQGGTANSSVPRRSTTTGKKAERKRVCKEAPCSSERKRPRDDPSSDEDGWHTVKR